MDARPVVGGERSCRQPDSLGAGNIQRVEHGGDCHPDRTCRTGGGLTFSIVAGTTVEETIEIDLSPAVLTSRTIDIPSTGFSATVDSEAGRVELHVPDGMGPGTAVNVEGLRMSVPESGIETLDARISTVENRLTPGSRVVRVIDGVADAIVIGPTTDPVFTYSSGQFLIDPLGHFTFSEGFAQAFDDGTDAGRTAPTEIIFQVSALPRNTQLRFPAEIESQTDATLTTANGEDVTLAAGASRNRVVYRFSSSARSRSVVDVFSFRPMLEDTGSVGAGTGFYQVTVGPIGRARPTGRLPSTAVPRYDELLLPDLPGLPASKTFLFPVERGVAGQSFTVSNTSDGVAPLTIRAFDEAGDLLDGPDVANEREQLLEARQTLAFDLEAMFGSGATAETVASVAIESGNDRPVATTIGNTPGGAYALSSQAPVEPAYFPFDRHDPGEMPLMSVAGAGRGGFRVPVDTHGRGRRRAGICRAGGRVRRCRPRFPGRPVRHHGRIGAAVRLRPGGIDGGRIPGKPRRQSRRGDNRRAGVARLGDQPVGVPLFRHRRGIQHRHHADQCFRPDRSRNGNRIRYRWNGNRARIYGPDSATDHG